MNDEWDSWGDGLALMEAYRHDATAELEKIDREALVKYRVSRRPTSELIDGQWRWIERPEPDLEMEALNDRESNLKTLLAHAEWAIKAAQEGRVSEVIFAAHSVRTYKSAVNWPRDGELVRKKRAVKLGTLAGNARGEQRSRESDKLREKIRSEFEKKVAAGHPPKNVAATMAKRSGYPTARTIRKYTPDFRNKTESS